MPTATRSAAFLLWILLASSAAAAEPSWGHLKARFEYDGKAPVRAPLSIDKDEAVCGKEKLLDERLLVHAKNGGVANVVVWMVVEKGQELHDEHPDYVAAKKKEVVLDSKQCRFQPHISLVRTNQTLFVANSDPIGHHANISVRENRHRSVISPSLTYRETYDKPEPSPASVSCSVHSWMHGYLLIQDHPYMAISNADGKLEIRNIPVGDWKFRAWHERAGWLQSVSIGERKISWKKGIIEVDLEPGEFDLGTIKLAPEVFKSK